MKRLLIVSNNLQVGGVQRALVNLLREIVPRYKVSLFLLAPEGPLLEELPSGVTLLRANPLLRVLGMSQARAQQDGPLPALWRGLLAVLTRLLGTRFVFPLLSRMQKIDGRYDAAASYLHNEGPHCFYGGCAELVLNAVQAERKLCFVHCDLEHDPANCSYNIRTLERFDRIAAVSGSIKHSVLRTAPGLAGRVFTVHNCHSVERILQQSTAWDVPRTEDAINLFSAARLSPEKGIARMIPILSQVRDMGVPFVWRIAGSGPEEGTIRRLIDACGLEEQVLLLGEQTNPYPWLRGADALLAPSFREAAPMVFGEAQVLGVPILTTDTASAAELVEEPGLGRVLPSDDVLLLQELARLLRDLPRFARLPLDNRRAVEEFDRLIQG